jgi:peptidoglycan/xylan/chitin deacetylase (PgdA/CDA1 family)
MGIKAQLGRVRRNVLTAMHRRPALLGDRGPIISFTFDDFPRTALTAGGEILKAHGLRGTYYTALGLMNGANHLGEQFRREDLDTLLRDGHELASHTFHHVSCRKMSAARFKDEVEQGRRALEKAAGLACVGSFAFPFGDVTLGAKRLAGPAVTSSRGIWGGLNGPDADLNLLRANSLYGDVGGVGSVQELIEENQRTRGWLIFYTHDVRSAPSRYGCTPELLKFAVSLASQQKARILTVAEVVKELTAPRS